MYKSKMNYQELKSYIKSKGDRVQKSNDYIIIFLNNGEMGNLQAKNMKTNDFINEYIGEYKQYLKLMSYSNKKENNITLWNNISEIQFKIVR